MSYRSRIIQNIAAMGGASVARISLGLLAFVVIARCLGPGPFGILMLWLSIAALVSLVANFGLATYSLREMAAVPQSAEAIVAEILTGKLLLAVIVLSCSVLGAMFVSGEVRWVFLFLVLAAIADSFTEFFNTVFRVRNRFSTEARVAVISSTTHAVILIGVVTISPVLWTVAGAYAVARMAVLAITLFAVTKCFAVPRPSGLKPAMFRLRTAVSYAMDFGVQSLFGQVDSVVLNYFIGPSAVGIYQAGLRIFQAGNQAAAVLANVFLPLASASHTSAEQFALVSRRMQIAFAAIGMTLGLVMAVLAEFIVQTLFGSDYFLLVELMPLFGLLFFLRFSAGAWGLMLTAAGHQAYRTVCGIATWIAVLAAGGWLVPLLGARGWLLALCCGTAILVIAYVLRCRKYDRQYWKVFLVSLVGSLIFFPFVKLA